MSSLETVLTKFMKICQNKSFCMELSLPVGIPKHIFLSGARRGVGKEGQSPLGATSSGCQNRPQVYLLKFSLVYLKTLSTDFEETLWLVGHVLSTSQLDSEEDLKDFVHSE